MEHASDHRQEGCYKAEAMLIMVAILFDRLGHANLIDLPTIMIKTLIGPGSLMSHRSPTPLLKDKLNFYTALIILSRRQY